MAQKKKQAKKAIKGKGTAREARITNRAISPEKEPVAEPTRFIVRGTVTDSNGKPLANAIMRAFDRDLRNEQQIGKDVVTDAEGHYEIRYTTKEFIAGDTTPNSSPDLFVRALGADGQTLAESPTRFNAGLEETIDLVIAAPKLSEWAIISQAVAPLLIGQGPEGKPLPPWELNDKDISFIVEETGLDREQVRLWVLAAKMAHEVELISPKPTFSHAAGTHGATSSAMNDALEFIAFYGWFRDGQPQQFSELIRRPIDTLMASLDHAVAQNYIPAVNSKLKDKLQNALDARRIDEVLRPASKGEPASLGDLLSTIPDDLLNENSRKTIAVLLNTVSHESDDFLQKAKDAGLNEIQALQVRQTLQLGDLTLKHKPMVKALQAVVKKDADITLNNLAGVRVNQWLELAFEHGAPPQTFMAPEQYADHLNVAVESMLPNAILLAKLENQAIKFEPKAFEGVKDVLTKYPKFDIAIADIDQFAIDTKINPETASALAKLQHLKRLNARWDEVEVLVNNGLDSAAEITHYSKDQFKKILSEQMPEVRLEAIHDQATALKAVSIGLMGYLLPMMYGVSAEVMGMHKNLAEAKEKINSNPTLRKLFGALEQCHCDPCLSVLSPAAYLADLLKFIDASHEAEIELRRRRPDIYDLELSCENSKIELPHIDLAIEILENAMAFPYNISLPSGTDVQTELNEAFVGNLVRNALQRTSMDELGALSAQKDTVGSTTWVVTDRYRRWTLDASSEIFGLEAGKQGEKAVSFDPSILDAIDPVPVLDSGNIPDDIEERVIKELEDGVIVKLPITAVVTDIMRLKSSQQSNTKKWEISFSSAGWISIELGNPGNTGTLTMGDSGDGKLTTKYYSNNLLIAMKNDLNTGVISPLIVRTLSDGRMNTKNSAKGFIVTGTDNWQFTYSGKRTIVYCPATIEITGLSYQSTAADRDLFGRSKNRNPLAYEKLSASDACFPWSLPYDFPLAETRETLRIAGVPRLSLLELTTAASDSYKSIAIARERLGLSSTEWGLINTPSVQISGGAKSEFWKIWGISGTKQTIKDTFIDQDITAAPFGNDGLLTRVSIILQQARLSFAELQQLLKSDFINPNGTVGIHPDNVCHPSEMRLSVVDANVLGPVLDRLHRFVRLWRATGWDIWELDLAITGICNRNIDSDDSLVQIANIGLLRDRLNLPIDVLVAMIGGFGNKQYTRVINGEFQNIVPLYDRLFQDRRLIDPPDTDLSFSATASSSVPIPGKAALIAAALGIRPVDLLALLSKSDVDAESDIDAPNPGMQGVISMQNLKWLFRNVTLAKALRLSLQDYVRVWHLYGASPFASPDALLGFLDEIGFVQQSSFSWSELEYILIDTETDQSEHCLSIQRAAEILSALQRELRQLNVPEKPNATTSFGITEEQIIPPLMPEVPSSEDVRWKHWRLEPIAGSLNWSVPDPADSSSKIDALPLDLLKRVDVLAQQARLTTDDLKRVLKTVFVDPARPQTLGFASQAGIETIQNLTADHLDRLERFVVMYRASRLFPTELDLLLQAFCRTTSTAAEPLTWDLGNLVRSGQAVLNLCNQFQLPLDIITGWWINGNGVDLIKLAESLGAGALDLNRLIEAFNAEKTIDPLATPSNLLEFVDASTSLKQRIELVTQRLAQAVSLEPSFVSNILWDYLHTSDTSPKPAMQHLISERFKNSTDTAIQDLLAESDAYAILIRLHKIALLNSKWKASMEELTWINAQGLSQSESFSGLVFDTLPQVKVQLTTANRDAIRSKVKALVMGWKRSTVLYQVAHATPEMAQVVSSYLDSYQKQKAATMDNKLKAARASLKALFNLSEATVEACVEKLGITANNPSEGNQYLDPLRFNELIGLLGTVQRLGINGSNLESLAAENPGLAGAELCRKLLIPRFGESGWKKALRQVTDALRIQQRDRLVDYLLTKEGLRDANSLYEHFLIDVEMSPCMNTTRMLQSTAAVQLFVQRCLFNLEEKVSPESIARDRWEWMQNYRVWEANRKVFLYPENWLFPEVRDDRTETFRAFESALTQSEPSHENATKALRQYLDDLVDVSQISVMGMYEHVESDAVKGVNSTLYVVGRTNNPPYRFFWRKANKYRENGMHWTGWERIDLDLSGDHLIPFVSGNVFYLAWPIFKQTERSGKTYYQLQMAWAKHTETGWTKRETSREYSKEVEKPFNRDERSLFTFRSRSNPVAQGIYIDAYKAEPLNRTEPLPYNPNKPNVSHIPFNLQPPPGNWPWTLIISLYCFDRYTGSNRIAKTPVAEISFRIKGLQIFQYVYAGDPANYPYKNYSSWSGPIYASASANSAVDVGKTTTFVSYKMMPGTYDLTLEVTAHGKPIPIDVKIDNLKVNKCDWVDVSVNVLFENIPDPVPSEVDPTARLIMNGFASLMLGGSEEASWQELTTSQIDPPENSYAWSGGFRERSNGGITLYRGSMPYFRPGFLENMLAIPASFNDPLSAIATWYVEEGDKRMFALLEDFFVQKLIPAGYTEASLYRHLGSNSLVLLFDVSTQEKGKNPWFGVDSIERWVVQIKAHNDPRDNVSLNYDLSMPNAGYNWEVFYHIPIAVAVFLSRQHRFEDARRWFHFVFDPTTNDPSTGRERFWRFLPFRNAQAPDTITKLLEALANPNAPSNQKDDVKQQIAAWLEDPFNPFAVARMRTSAFEWYTVVAYIKNLIAWADQLFRRDTRESINEATLLYIMAAQILGPRPEKIRARKGYQQSLSYRFLKALKGDLDSFSNVWLSLADSPLMKAWIEFLKWLAQHGINPQSAWDQIEQLSSIGSLYFCVPPNEKLPELWDTVDDRLFKIRHCQNIEGITRSLPLYEPPIDPELLIRAKAAGLDLADVLADRFAPLPHYRFQILLQKANEFCNEVKSLGGAILSAVEKKEAEHLALLRSSQEIAMLKLIESVKEEQIKEAQANIDALNKTRSNAQDRFVFLQRQLGKNQITFDASGSPLVEQSLMTQVQETGIPDDFGALSLIRSEIDQIGWMQASNDWALVSSGTRVIAGALHAAGVYLPAKSAAEALGFAASAAGDAIGMLATNAAHQERRSGMLAGWQRRRDEWVQQSRMTAEEIRQIDKQIIALVIRKSIAEKELENHRKQIEHASNIDDYMRHLKFSGESLYGWMESQIAGLYFSAYQMAYDLAKKAERAYQFELGEPSSSFVQFGHWDSMRKGLLSGERLSQNLRRMEAAHLERNRREYEITKHISLQQLNANALLQLKTTSSCEFTIPEWIFDLDCPGHYMRRIKTVSVSIPCVAGPYTSINCTLSLQKSTIRKSALLKGNEYRRDGSEDDRFIDYYGTIQSIVTSNAQNDSGLFETNLRDERYLPFEGAGAEGTWMLELPSDFKQFDYNTISDVIIHIRYTAREGGGLKAEAVSQIEEIVKDANASGLTRLFSLKHDFPTEWHRFVASKTNEDFKAIIKKDYFPYLAQSSDIQINKIDLFSIKDKDLKGRNINIPADFNNNIKAKNKDNQSELPIPKADVDKDAEVLLILSYSLEK